jgi:hypothetical protein
MESFEIGKPELLFGHRPLMSKEELLSAMPSRPVADRLVSRYLNTRDFNSGKRLALCMVSNGL